MKVLFAGMADRIAAALDILIHMSWKDALCVHLPRNPSLSVPPQTAEALLCDLCVVDLFGLGLRKYGGDSENKLLKLLNGRPAVVLLWGSDGGGWPLTGLPLAPGQSLIWMRVPYSAQDMRDALARLRTQLPAEPAAPAALLEGVTTQPLTSIGVLPAALQPAPRLVSAGGMTLELDLDLSDPEELAPPGATSALPGELPSAPSAPELALRGEPACAALAQTFPELARHTLWLWIGQVLSRQSSCALVVDGRTELLLHPQEGWLMAYSPWELVQQWLLRPQSAAQLNLGAASAQDLMPGAPPAEASCQQPVALDVFLWRLVSPMLQGLSLVPAQDLRFALHRFPNFTQLEEAPALHLQLAAICVRQPRSVAELHRAFDKQHAEDISRFVVLALASGLASVLPQAAPTLITLPTPAPPPPAMPVQAPALAVPTRPPAFGLGREPAPPLAPAAAQAAGHLAARVPVRAGGQTGYLAPGAALAAPAAPARRPTIGALRGAARTAVPPEVRRGFFQALLDKLR